MSFPYDPARHKVVSDGSNVLIVELDYEGDPTFDWDGDEGVVAQIRLDASELLTEVFDLIAMSATVEEVRSAMGVICASKGRFTSEVLDDR